MNIKSLLLSLIIGSYLCTAHMVYAQAPTADEKPIAEQKNIAQPIIDSRIKTVDYNRNMIVPLLGHTGFQTTVEFEAGEVIETVGIGDSTGWQVTPNSAGSVLFLKPTQVSPPTNLSIITNRRHYNIELMSRSGEKVDRKSILYVLRFRVQAPKQEKVEVLPPPISPVVPEQWNRNYSYSGSEDLVPLEVFDDGISTYFRLSPGSETPAIFATSKKEGDNLVNISVRGPFLVVDRIGAEFVMKLGRSKTYIFNEAIPTADMSGGPKRREQKRKRFLGIF